MHGGHQRDIRVLAAMSGGVDSSTAAAILVREGYRVEGVFMDLWDCSLAPSKAGSTCCSPRDRADARAVADALGIPLRVVDLQEVFRCRVIDAFARNYLEGRTPNPCILCNEYVKYGALLELAREKGARFLATGHYARNVWDPEAQRFRLLKGSDRRKDQSYFLFPLGQAQLAHVLWPLGERTKHEVREASREFGLPVSEKMESQEICFVADGDYRGFLETYLPPGDLGPGEVIGPDGAVLGMHGGVHGFTVGQRRGLGIPWKEPLYVIEIRPLARQIVVGPERQLAGRLLEAQGVSWVAGRPPGSSFRAKARIRYRHREAPALVEVVGKDRIRLVFDTSQRAITPGQAVVLYRGEELLGGGWISEARG